MKTLWILLRKDTRALKWWLIGWLLLQLLHAVIRWILAEYCILSPSATYSSAPLQTVSSFIAVTRTQWLNESNLIVFYGLLFVRKLWHLDPLNKESAHWRVLPFTRCSIWSSKLVFMLVWIALLPILINAVYGSILKLGPLLPSFLINSAAIWLAPFAVSALVASLTSRIQHWVAGIGIFCMILINGLLTTVAQGNATLSFASDIISQNPTRLCLAVGILALIGICFASLRRGVQKLGWLLLLLAALAPGWLSSERMASTFTGINRLTRAPLPKGDPNLKEMKAPAWPLVSQSWKKYMQNRPLSINLWVDDPVPARTGLVCMSDLYVRDTDLSYPLPAEFRHSRNIYELLCSLQYQNSEFFSSRPLLTQQIASFDSVLSMDSPGLITNPVTLELDLALASQSNQKIVSLPLKGGQHLNLGVLRLSLYERTEFDSIVLSERRYHSQPGVDYYDDEGNVHVLQGPFLFDAEGFPTAWHGTNKHTTIDGPLLGYSIRIAICENRHLRGATSIAWVDSTIKLNQPKRYQFSDVLLKAPEEPFPLNKLTFDPTRDSVTTFTQRVFLADSQAADKVEEMATKLAAIGTERLPELLSLSPRVLAMESQHWAEVHEAFLRCVDRLAEAQHGPLILAHLQPQLDYWSTVKRLGLEDEAWKVILPKLDAMRSISGNWAIRLFDRDPRQNTHLLCRWIVFGEMDLATTDSLRFRELLVDLQQREPKKFMQAMALRRSPSNLSLDSRYLKAILGAKSSLLGAQGDLKVKRRGTNKADIVDFEKFLESRFRKWLVFDSATQSVADWLEQHAEMAVWHEDELKWVPQPAAKPL